jgi:hypothetical protein
MKPSFIFESVDETRTVAGATLWCAFNLYNGIRERIYVNADLDPCEEECNSDRRLCQKFPDWQENRSVAEYLKDDPPAEIRCSLYGRAFLFGPE